MIDKSPKTENNNKNADGSKKIGDKHIAKMHEMLEGKTPSVDIGVVDIEKDEEPLLGTVLSADMEKKDEAGKDKTSPQKGGTWHDKYDNY